MASPQLMTYSELATVWGVSKEAARKKVEGLRLPRQMGNDGRARVMVDLTEVQHEPMKPKSTGRRARGDRPETTLEADLRRLVSTLEAEVERLTALDALRRSDFEHERNRADGLSRDLASTRDALAAMTAERDMERARAAQVDALNAVLDIERRHADTLRQDRDRWAVQAHALAHPPARPTPERRRLFGWIRHG